MSQTCSVCCCDILVDENMCRLPGCNHTFHASCILNAVQYDTRCPVCRRQPDGVTTRATTETEATETRQLLTVDEEQMRRAWRNYIRRRNRRVSSRPELRKAFDELKLVRTRLTAETTAAQRVYDRRCRDVWTHDEEIVAHKKVIKQLRRKQTQLERVLNAGTEDLTLTVVVTA